MIYKSYKTEVEKFDDDKRIIEHFITLEQVDRDNEIVLVNGIKLDNYRGRVLWAHGYDFNRGSVPIAKNEILKKSKKDDKKGLKALTQFYDDEFSLNIYRMNRMGFLGDWSIGFLPLKSRSTDEDGHGVWEEIELLEYSSVPIPANPGAINMALTKGLINDKEKRFWDLVSEVGYPCESFYEQAYKTLLADFEKLNDEANNMRIALPDMTNQRNALLDKLRQTIGKELPAQDYELGKLFIPILIKIFKFGDLAEKNDDMIGEENLNETKWFLRSN